MPRFNGRTISILSFLTQLHYLEHHLKQPMDLRPKSTLIRSFASGCASACAAVSSRSQRLPPSNFRLPPDLRPGPSGPFTGLLSRNPEQVIITLGEDIQTCMHACMYISIYTCTCILMCVYMYMYKCIYTREATLIVTMLRAAWFKAW